MNVDDAPQFIDTNILVYAYDVTAGAKNEIARQLVAALWKSRAGCISIQVLQEFYTVVTRKIAKPLPPQTAAQIISDLAAWQVHQPQVHDILGAIELQQRFQLSFWDAMIVHSAHILGCEIVWSEDLNHSQSYYRVTVSNPFKATAFNI